MNIQILKEKTSLLCKFLIAMLLSGHHWSSAATGEKCRLKDSQFMLLGTGAGEGMPSFFCDCDFCRKARKAGGKNFRFRSAYQLGDTIRIDWGPDGAIQSRAFKLQPWKLRHLFFTHSHEDHCWGGDFWVRKASRIPGNQIMKVYANQEVMDIVSKAIHNDWKGHLMEPVLMVPGKKITIPELQITVTALHANHTGGEKSLMYHFKTPYGEILFTGDTGQFMPSAWEHLKGASIDYMIVDTTWGMEEPGGGHLGFHGAVQMARQLKEQNLAAPNMRVITTHMAHTAGARLHSELEKELKKWGMEPGFDGMIIDMNKK